MRSLLDLQASWEISEAEADELHEAMMSRIEIDFLIQKTREAEWNALLFKWTTDGQPSN